MEDTKKATWKYLSMSGSEYSFEHSTEERKKALLGCECTTDIVESGLGGCTQQIQKYGRINIKAAAATSDVGRNGYLRRIAKGKKKGKNVKKKGRGLFHQYSTQLQHCIVLMAMQDAPETRKLNTEELDKQRECKRNKEEMMKRKGMEEATEAAIDASYYYDMWSSDACWKGDTRAVKRNLDKMTSDAQRLQALKENIRIRLVPCREITPSSRRGM